MLLTTLFAVAVTQTVDIPTRLVVTRSTESLGVSVDQLGKRRQSIAASPGAILGVEYELRVQRRGEKKVVSRQGLSSGTSFELGSSFFHREPDGLPVERGEYVIEVKLVLFETNVPPQHHWTPRSGTFRALWRGSLTAVR